MTTKNWRELLEKSLVACQHLQGRGNRTSPLSLIKYNAVDVFAYGGEYARAELIVQGIETPAHRVHAFASIARHGGKSDYVTIARGYAERLGKMHVFAGDDWTAVRSTAFSHVASASGIQTDFTQAEGLATLVKDPNYRASAFAALAVARARIRDFDKARATARSIELGSHAGMTFIHIAEITRQPRDIQAAAGYICTEAFSGNSKIKHQSINRDDLATDFIPAQTVLVAALKLGFSDLAQKITKIPQSEQEQGPLQAILDTLICKSNDEHTREVAAVCQANNSMGVEYRWMIILRALMRRNPEQAIAVAHGIHDKKSLAEAYTYIARWIIEHTTE